MDYDNAVKFCSSEEVLAKTLEQFYNSIEPNSLEIENYFNNKDYKNYTIKVHALKSSARLIGAESLSQDAMHLEDCGNNLDIESIESLTPKLLKDYRDYKSKLAPLYAKAEAELAAAPEIDINTLNEAYEAIAEFAGNFDIDTIDGILEDLRKYRMPEAERDKFNAIDKSVRNSDWAGLKEALGI
ncbi:MAG: Hpt domain-containing protein [Synergistaceae bacterium]|nr:Hpt domain-containing protein [Synergistaceae bacterium]